MEASLAISSRHLVANRGLEISSSYTLWEVTQGSEISTSLSLSPPGCDHEGKSAHLAARKEGGPGPLQFQARTQVNSHASHLYLCGLAGQS